jgi:hypothetical protein
MKVLLIDALVSVLCAAKSCKETDDTVFILQGSGFGIAEGASSIERTKCSLNAT